MSSVSTQDAVRPASPTLDGGSVIRPPAETTRAKVILSGELKRKVTLQGPSVVATKGARAAIEKAGGRIEEGKAA